MSDRTAFHVVCLGLHESELDVLDFDRHLVTAVMSKRSADRLPPESLAPFREVVAIDIASGDDLNSYDDAIGLVRHGVARLAARWGPPDAVVGLYEHTVLPAARIRADYGLQGTSVRSAELCRDKVLMKRAVQKAGIQVPRFHTFESVESEESVEAFVKAVGGRVVIKPRDQSASTGVMELQGVSELRDAIRLIDRLVSYEVEEFIDGEILHLDGVVRRGEIHFFTVSRYLNSCMEFQQSAIPVASVTIDDPALIGSGLIFASRVIGALNLRDSAFHLEAFLVDDQFVFLEIGARFGGAGIPILYREIYGVSLQREAVRVCTGEPTGGGIGASSQVDLTGGIGGFVLTPLATYGRVERVSGIDALPQSVVHVEVPTPGDVLEPGVEVWPTSGRFWLCGTSSLAVEEDIGHIAATYSVSIGTSEERE